MLDKQQIENKAKILRIGIDATSIPCSIAGAGRYIFGLIQGLTHCKTNFEFYIYCKQSDQNKFGNLPPNFRIRPIPHLSRPTRIYWQLLGLHDWLQEDRIDLWHSTHYIMPVRRLDIPVLVTIHDLAFFHFPHFYSVEKRLFFQWSISRAAKKASSLIAVSKSTQRDLKLRFPQINSSHCVYSGIHREHSTHPNGQKSAYPEFYLLSVGTQEKRKNLPFLIRVFHYLLDEFPDLHLILPGKSENDTANIRKIIHELSLENRVLLPGYVTDEKLWQYYKNAAAFCMPSHYEGFGFPVLESMACGTPVIVSDRPAMIELGREFVFRAKCGNLNEWKEITTQVLRQQFSAEKLQGGAAYAQSFSWKRTAECMLDIYSAFHTQARVAGSNEHLVDTILELKENGLQPVKAAVLKTLAFADVFDYPLTMEEIHAGLIECRAARHNVKQALAELIAEHRIGLAGNAYFLQGRSQISRLRKKRNSETEHLLFKNERMLQRICNFPGVKAVAISGAAAFGNCNSDDDIDLFIITEKKRLWTVYTFLALLFKITRQRRIFCLNYMISEDCNENLSETLFTAHQITHLRPIFNPQAIGLYKKQHKWTDRYLPQKGTLPPIPIAVSATSNGIIRKILQLRLFDLFELFAFKVYSFHIRRITKNCDTKSVEVSRQKIKLFTNDHSDSVMQAYAKRLINLSTNTNSVHRKSISNVADEIQTETEYAQL